MLREASREQAAIYICDPCELFLTQNIPNCVLTDCVLTDVADVPLQPPSAEVTAPTAWSRCTSHPPGKPKPLTPSDRPSKDGTTPLHTGEGASTSSWTTPGTVKQTRQRPSPTCSR
eukprot:8130065-Pyramimonas_sp.AAC.1